VSIFTGEHLYRHWVVESKRDPIFPEHSSRRASNLTDLVSLISGPVGIIFEGDVAGASGLHMIFEEGVPPIEPIGMESSNVLFSFWSLRDLKDVLHGRDFSDFLCNRFVGSRPLPAQSSVRKFDSSTMPDRDIPSLDSESSSRFHGSPFDCRILLVG